MEHLILMPQVKVVVSIQSDLLRRIDELVKAGLFRDRSTAIESAIRERFRFHDPKRLARECQKLDPKLEQALAEEGVASDMAEWPEY